MLWAILITLASVLLGTALAIMPSVRQAWMGPLRTFALISALAVVVMHLLPIALAEIGGWAVLVFLFGLVAPEALGKLGETLWRARRSAPAGPQNAELRRVMALEATYFGLLLHRVGDGLGLGAFTGEMYSSAGSAGVIVALSAHAVPVVAIMVLAFDSVQGRGSALTRALGLWVASTIGVWFSHSLPQAAFAQASAYISAFVGGTLLHVVTHDLAADLPRTRVQRAADLVALGLGVYVSLIGHAAHAHDGGPEDIGEHMLDVLSAFGIATAPALVFGVAAAALLAQRSRPARPSGVAPSELVLQGTGSFGRRALHTFDELLHHVGAWIVLGVVASALLEIALPGFGIAMAMVVLGPATIFATLPLLKRWYGANTALMVQLGILGVVWLLGGAVRVFIHPELTQDRLHDHLYGPVILAAAALSGLILVRAVYRAGVRGFFSTLVGQHGHSHGEVGSGYSFEISATDQTTPVLLSHGHAHGGEPCHHAHGPHDD